MSRLTVLFYFPLLHCATTQSRGQARFVVDHATPATIAAKAAELCGSGVRYSVETTGNHQTYSNIGLYVHYTTTEIVCDRAATATATATDPDDATQRGYCAGGRGSVALVGNLSQAVAVSGEVIADHGGRLYRGPSTLGGSAQLLEVPIRANTISHRAGRYCALSDDKAAVCFTLDVGRPAERVVRVSGTAKALVGDLVLMDDGTLKKDGATIAKDVTAAAASASATCILRKNEVMCADADGASFAPVSLKASGDQLWITPTTGFVVAKGNVVATWPMSTDLFSPTLPLNTMVTGVTSGNRLACLARRSAAAACWDMLETVPPALTSVSFTSVAAGGSVVCGVNAQAELYCVGEQRRTSSSVSSLTTLMREVHVASDVAAFDLTDQTLTVVRKDGSVLIFVSREC